MLDFESDYWTPEQEQSFLESRKNKLKRAMKNAGYSNPVNESRMYTGYFDIPSDLEEMIKIKNILAKRNTFNPKLADKVGDQKVLLIQLAYWENFSGQERVYPETLIFTLIYI